MTGAPTLHVETGGIEKKRKFEYNLMNIKIGDKNGFTVKHSNYLFPENTSNSL